MFGLGFTEILLLILIAFLIFGPQQFPTVAKNFIKILNEIKNAFTEVKSEFYDIQTEANKQIHEITDKLGEELDFIKDIQKEVVLNKEKNEKDSKGKKESS